MVLISFDAYIRSHMIFQPSSSVLRSLTQNGPSALKPGAGEAVQVFQSPPGVHLSSAMAAIRGCYRDLFSQSGNTGECGWQVDFAAASVSALQPPPENQPTARTSSNAG
jgi:hypothetical protein